MKVEDLMIGDWVNVFENPKQIDGIRKFRNGDEFVYYDGDNGNVIESVTPITLTPEILELNGVKYDDRFVGECYIICGTAGRCLVWNNLSKSLSNGLFTLCKCEYVHELQHALKLCGIDKEITL